MRKLELIVSKFLKKSSPEDATGRRFYSKIKKRKENIWKVKKASDRIYTAEDKDRDKDKEGERYS